MKTNYFILFIIFAIPLACKTRNVAKNNELTTVKQHLITTSETQLKLNEKLTVKTFNVEESGIWTWDEWYSDENYSVPNASGDTKPKKPVHRRTTFSSFKKNDSTQTNKNIALESDSKEDVNLKIDSLKKTEEKLTESKGDLAWILWLSVLVCVIVAICLLIKKLRK